MGVFWAKIFMPLFSRPEFRCRAKWRFALHNLKKHGKVIAEQPKVLQKNNYFAIWWARNNKQTKGVGNEENRSIRGGDCCF